MTLIYLHRVYDNTNEVMYMPRLAREKSITGIYHIMLRGIDKRDIFLEDEDKIKFLNSVKKAKEVGKFELYGYCLMDNHIHLLMRENEEIGTSIKRFTVGYVGWHNKKYERTGHLFQNRYLSERVDTEGYLLTVLRYIHQNPVRAKMVNKVEQYKWSSFYQYYLYYNDYYTIVNGEIMKVYFDTYEKFSEYTNIDNEDECLEQSEVLIHNDGTVKNMILEKYNLKNLANLTNEERYYLIKDIYSQKGASIRELSRIFGVGKTIIEKIIKKDS